MREVALVDAELVDFCYAGWFPFTKRSQRVQHIHYTHYATLH
jgi:hypothetical protein